MDLKDILAEVETSTREAVLAFHAGHHDITENYLMNQMLTLCAYFDDKKEHGEPVTKATDKQVQEDEQKEKPAAVPGASLHPGPFGPAEAYLKFGVPQTEQKPTQ